MKFIKAFSWCLGISIIMLTPKIAYEQEMTTEEGKCFKRCVIGKNKTALMTEIGCFCGTNSQFIKKMYPRKHK